VRGRRCVVVGAGPVGARKARALADAGADVLFVAPEAGEEARALCESGRATHTAAPFSPETLDGAFLCVAATDIPAVNETVSQAARARGVLVNLAAAGEDEDTGGDFATMAAVRRGDLLVALTTGGAGPALSARLRRELEETFGPAWAGYVALLGEARRRAKFDLPDPEQRTRALRRLAASDTLRARALAGDLDGAREEVAACLS
jgi:precorrin-2 dehydrogenase/sirohydrochlorin ferrochelatase